MEHAGFAEEPVVEIGSREKQSADEADVAVRFGLQQSSTQLGPLFFGEFSLAVCTEASVCRPIDALIRIDHVIERVPDARKQRIGGDPQPECLVK